VQELKAALAGPLSFTVRSGEILGIAGVDGSGRESVASALFGGLPRQGVVRFGGRELPAMRPDLSARRGMGYVPVDRAKDAMFGRMSLIDNVMAPRRKSRFGGLVLDAQDEVSVTRAWIERLDIKPPRATATIETLSGGNQQKAIVARWLRLNPSAMVFDEPTKGVDVGAVAAIWELIQQAAEQGAAVVVCSSVSGELASYCSRVLVMRRGLVVGEFQGNELNDHTIDAVALVGESSARQEGLDE
jgi:ribose transport system ATP-binding protein